MVTHMKTTIDIADPLLREAKRRAQTENRTLRDLVEEGLRRVLEDSRSASSFRLDRHVFKGQGTQAGVAEGDWATIRDLIYRI